MRLNRCLRQIATYWAPSGTISADGSEGYSTPVSVSCRWEEKSILFLDPTGKEKLSQAVIYLAVDVAIAGFLYLGVSTEADPRKVAAGQEIKQFSKIPDKWGFTFERRAYV